MKWRNTDASGSPAAGEASLRTDRRLLSVATRSERAIVGSPDGRDRTDGRLGRVGRRPAGRPRLPVTRLGRAPPVARLAAALRVDRRTPDPRAHAALAIAGWRERVPAARP